MDTGAIPGPLSTTFLVFPQPRDQATPECHKLLWEGREAEKTPPLPQSLSRDLGQSSASLPFLKFHKHDSADSMKPIMNEQCLPGLLAIFYKNSMLAAPRPSHVALRLSHLLPRPSHLLPRPSHLLPRPSHLLPRPSHLLENSL